jgi:hypothetical protein
MMLREHGFVPEEVVQWRRTVLAGAARSALGGVMVPGREYRPGCNS